MGGGGEALSSEVSLWSPGRIFFIRQEDLAGFRKESKHPQKQRKHLPISVAVTDSWQPHSCFFKSLLTEEPLCACLCMCKISSRFFVTTENKQQQLPLSTCSTFYTKLSPGVGSGHSLHDWQHCTAVAMAWVVSHPCKGIPTVGHNCPAAPALPTGTSASLNIVRRKYGWDKITTTIHLTERRNWNPRNRIWGASCHLVIPSPSPWPCHHQALYGWATEGFAPHSEASLAVFKEIICMNPVKWVLYLPYVNTYLGAYKKTSTIGCLLTEKKRLYASLPALRRCSESWFPLPVCFSHFN